MSSPGSFDKFRVDDIVCEEARDLAKHYECSVCLNLVEDPLQTACCSSIFCTSCIEHPSVRSCPTCRVPFGRGTEATATRGSPLKKSNIHALRMINKINVYCPWSMRHRQTASSGGSSSLSSTVVSTNGSSSSTSASSSPEDEEWCQWKGEYGDLMGKHLANCQFAKVTCECGLAIRRKDRNAHKLICPSLLVACKICGLKVKPADLAVHDAAAAVQHVAILQKQMMERGLLAARRDQVSSQLSGVDLKLDAHRAAANSDANRKHEDLKGTVSSSAANHYEFAVESRNTIVGLLVLAILLQMLILAKLGKDEATTATTTTESITCAPPAAVKREWCWCSSF
ncbi:unnamed protein product [Amoebophrya sp. A120]|nr:unnamed protein product [Amoebophrya sp. A120]|eukprot:GSA120T00006807001.1